MDPRKDEPYEKYAEVEFEVPVGERGDSYDRLWVLVERVKQSCNIIEQCIDKLPPGPFRASGLPKTLKIPEGEIYVRNENPLGVMGYYVVGDGKKYPYRVKMRTAQLLERGRDPRGAAGRADPRPDLDPRLDLLRRRRRRQVDVGYPCAPDGASHASRRFPRLVSGRGARRRPGGELAGPRHDGDQAVRVRHLGSDPRRARPALQADRSREPVLPDAHPAVAPGEGEGARRGVRARGRRGHARRRRGARRAAGPAPDVRDDHLGGLFALGAELSRPAVALQPVGQRRPVGDASAPVPAHHRVPVAGRAHRARDPTTKPGRRPSACSRSIARWPRT